MHTLREFIEMNEHLSHQTIQTLIEFQFHFHFFSPLIFLFFIIYELHLILLFTCKEKNSYEAIITMKEKSVKCVTELTNAMANIYKSRIYFIFFTLPNHFLNSVCV